MRMWLMKDHYHQAEAFGFGLRSLLILSKAEQSIDSEQ